MTEKNLDVAVVIASLGRPAALADCVEMLRAQTVKPSHIVLSVTSENDLPDRSLLDGIEIIIGPKGACQQRNRGIEQVLNKADAIAFFDDDYIGSRFAIEGIAAFMKAHPDVVGMNGLMLADGVKGPGITKQEAEELIRAYDSRADRDPAEIKGDLEGLYGCNMVCRMSAIGDVRFDAKLPLYAWQEDIDFTASIQKASGGRLVATNAFAGVHRGEKSGRTSGVRLGYSQIANPVYLMRKGTMSGKFGRRIMWRNFVANHIKTLRPEPWVDRWGRTRGNWLAISDWLTRRIDPNKVVDFK